MRRPRDDSEDDEIPLHHKKPFGSGLKRKKIEFVRATESDDGKAAVPKPRAATAIGDLYASIVLGDGQVSSASAPATTTASPQPGPSNEGEPDICPVCSLPITTSLKEHGASLAHQVSMPHSHPPSALDRSRMGLRALKSQGWDPDARRGLGVEGEGVRYPIKTKAKDDNLGIGAAELLESQKQEPREPPPRKLTGKELKEAMAKEKQRAERLQAEIYGRVDVESYLRRKMDNE
ncbi:G-patch domain protein, putative [Metarhizium acridum CQMa 102]|uniref:G-patch domain protein, putative n=1 Tax=Metarhizium acridum (strain CQMa 102) TaxID=655827 RepID=E9E276_METAQ|nr:G-patch domain protein, putative [Metarhizium acridum CQMa 102]EFY89992.1 G-patch domain protein, putative [Metarhizium acridum CQMa 102]